VTPPPGTRTSLAWQRTGLGMIGVAALLGGRAFHTGSPSLLVTAGAAALVGAAVLGVLAPVRVRQLQRRRATGEGVAAPGPVAAVTVAVVLVAVVAIGSVLVTLP
jgi:putative membrane protein